MADRLAEDQINSFLAIAQGADEKTATAFLKGANNDFERAIQDYFDDPQKYLNQNRYDESVWYQGREGNLAGPQPPAFQIECGPSEQFPQSTAPTRPPSRASQNSSTKGIPGSPQTGHDDPWQGQEMGVVSAAGAQFGPATREYYDNNSWAMTVPGSSAVELVPDPFPTMRKRDPGEPVFMKPLSNRDYLPSLVTILHSIPLAHSALNLQAQILGQYNSDSAWWCGSTIKNSQVVDTQSEEPVDHGREFLQETQRLMAFLDLSERSYGSVDALSQMKVLEEESLSDRLKTLCDRFLMAWEACAARTRTEVSDQRSLFRSEVMIQTPGRPADTTPFCTLSVTLTNQGTGARQTIYDALDELIWSDDAVGSSVTDQAISVAGDVLCMRVEQPDFASPGLNFAVPAAWYADRYMVEHAARAKAMRRTVAEQHVRVAQIDEQIQRDIYYTDPRSGKTLNILDMLRTAKAAFEPPQSIALGDDGEEFDFVAESKNFDIRELNPRPDVLEQLEMISSSIQSKLEHLEHQKRMIKESIQKEIRLLKAPSEDVNELQPLIRYSLCGVATDFRTTYLLQRAAESLIEMSDEAPVSDQWWKLHYSNDPAITKEKVTEADVLKHASDQSRDVMLVYATDTALQPIQVAINQPLQAFIRQDNANFAAELADAEAAVASKSQTETAAEAAALAPLLGWETVDEPQGNDPNGDEGFVPDDGTIQDHEQYAKDSMLQRAKRIKQRNEEARLAATQGSAEASNGSADDEGQMVQHVENIGGAM